MSKKHEPDDTTPTPFTVTLEAHIVQSIQKMEAHSKIPKDELVRKALLMFIATHNDYLGLRGN